MEDTLGLKDDNKKLSTSEWPLAVEDDLSKNSFQITSSQQHLQVIPKNEMLSDCPVIPATFMEKLSFYRAYICTVSKIEIFCEQQDGAKGFLWFYVFNGLFKSLPMTYVYLFLSTYSPDHHLFVSKMVPLFYGFNFILLITGFFGLAIMAHSIVMFTTYFINGLFYNIPWNRRGKETDGFYDNQRARSSKNIFNANKLLDTLRPKETECPEKEINMSDFQYSCLNLHEFAQKINNSINVTYDTETYLYVTGQLEYFNLAQITYFEINLVVTEGPNFLLELMGDMEFYRGFLDAYETSFHFNKIGTPLLILTSLWLLAACLRNHITKRYIWQTLHRAQLLLCGLYIILFLHLLLSYEDKQILHYIKNKSLQHRITLMADADLLAESMTAPPVVHIISSKSSEEVKSSLHSALIIASNSIFYIFRAMTSYLCNKYCENWINTSIIYWNYNSSSIFYMWPIYFATIYLGDILVLVFFALHAVVDYCTFLIAFQCLVQTFISEWRWIKPWLAVIIILFAAFALYLTDDTFCETSYILWTSISTLSEVLLIFWAYPMGRFFDDITFHYGVPPTKLRICNFTTLPFFYLIKVYFMLKIFVFYDYYGKTVQRTTWILWLYLFLFLVGAIYAFYYYVYKQKRNFIQLLKPAPEWGPKNFKIRQLRKQFNSRDYIGSQSPRDLSSHLTEKTEMTSYKLDIRYDSYSRRTTYEASKEY